MFASRENALCVKMSIATCVFDKTKQQRSTTRSERFLHLPLDITNVTKTKDILKSTLNDDMSSDYDEEVDYMYLCWK